MLIRWLTGNFVGNVEGIQDHAAEAFLMNGSAEAIIGDPFPFDNPAPGSGGEPDVIVEPAAVDPMDNATTIEAPEGTEGVVASDAPIVVSQPIDDAHPPEPAA